MKVSRSFSCCIFVILLILSCLLLSFSFVLQHALPLMFSNIASNRQFPCAAFNIPAFTPQPCRYALDIARCRSIVVILIAVFMSMTSCGINLFYS